ncbi:MAG: hypothetical protein V1707_00335 [bacterium]
MNRIKITAVILTVFAFLIGCQKNVAGPDDDTKGYLLSKVVVDGETSPKIITAGSAGVIMAKYQFYAGNEDMKITKLKFTGSPAQNYDAVWLLDDANIYKVYLDGTGIAKFTDLQIAVPKDSWKTIVVKADLKSISGGAVSGGTQFFVRMNAGASVSDVDLEAVSASGVWIKGSSVVKNDLDGPNMKLYKSIPEVGSLLAGFDPQLGNLGPNTPIYRFVMLPDAKGAVSIKKLTFNVVASGVVVSTAATDWSLWNVTGTPYLVSQASDIVPPSSPSGGVVVINLAASREIEIPALGDGKFELRTFVSGSLTGASISTYIVNDVTANSASAASGSVTGDFVWSDQSDPAGHRTSSADYNNGFAIKYLPTAPLGRHGL